MLEKRVCAAQRDKDEAVVRGRKPVSVPAQSAVPLAGD
jgi:hypothetical protein